MLSDLEWEMGYAESMGVNLLGETPDEEYERESAVLARHAQTCTADGFCLLCQSL